MNARSSHLFPRLLVATSQREAFRLRGEYASLEAVADRRPEDTAFVVENIVSVLKPGPTDRVLDIGCGDGEFLKRVAPLVARSAAVDLSPVGLAKLRGHLPSSTNALLSAGVSEALPFRDAAFSMVMINSVLYALGSYEEAERTVAEVRRVLTAGGIAYFGEVPTVDERKGARPSRSLLGTIQAKLKRHGLRGVLRILRERLREPLQIVAPDTFLFWPPRDFTALLEKHGFRVAQALRHRTLAGLTTRLNYVAVRTSRPQ